MTERLRMSDDNRRWWTLAAMCFALFMVMLDNTVVNVALPSIQADFDASLSALEWTINAYTLTFAVLLVTGGRLGDLFGRRRIFLYGVVIFALSSATIALAPTDGWLVASRAVQGVGAALMMPGSLSILTNAFPPAERGKAIGTWAGVSALALAIGPLVGGYLTEEVSWRAIFLLNLPVAAGALVMTLFAAEESRDETAERKVDIPGIVALTVSLASLVLALVEGNSWGWGSAGVIGLLVLSVAAGVAFVAIERRARVPIVDFAFFKARSFVGANIVAFTVSFAMFAMFFFIALYMQNVLGYSPLQAGVRFLPSTLVVMVTGPIAGRLADRLGARPLMVGGLLITSVALFLQSRIDVGSGYGTLWPGFVLMGLGLGLIMSPMSMAAMNSVDRSKAGVASGTLSMFRMVGGTFGVAALGALVAGVGRHDLEQSLPGLTGGARERVVEGLGSAAALEGAPTRVVDAAHAAFVDALSQGLTVASIATLAAAVVAWFLISPKPPAPAPERREPEPASEALAEAVA
ncbi:MAG: MFS transporter [Solirubrobacteraceae bacterium]